MIRGPSKGVRRKRAGRPRLGAERRRAINLTLPESQIRRARWLGEGSVSLGISRAIETCPDWARKLE